MPPEGRIQADCGPGNGQNRGSAGNCGNHCGNAHEVDGASQVVGHGGAFGQWAIAVA